VQEVDRRFELLVFSNGHVQGHDADPVRLGEAAQGHGEVALLAIERL